MGCFVTGIGLFGLAWAVVAVPFIWLGQAAGGRGAGEKMLMTLAVLGFTALFLAVAWGIRRVVDRMARIAAGGMTPAAMGIEPIARCRFVFPLPDGREAEATASVNLRSRLQAGRAGPDDVAIYVPGEPQRALLLGGFWPPLTLRDGEWVQRRPPREVPDSTCP